MNKFKIILLNFKSILHAMIGIQTKQNLVKDFQRTNISQIIILGVIATIVFILSIILVVKIVLN